ncbi:hypothetical protein QBC35DRAFT_55206 [Podospora australis]|uniref:DNA replication ATP-dependent helicase/nuclease n=1 Tax=Podospora australis TaxID=1536484 RepID=A0AAN6WZE0_9PEZI|nr:hypothetical protein QBC35DRAFT_55206 [Podospora australis]
MPPLEKSHSDVVSSRSRKRSQWNRSKSNPTPQPAKALPVSDKTRCKLDDFKFDSKTSESEAALVPENNQISNKSNPNQQSPLHPLNADAVANTPANQLKWHDLIGKPEVATTIEEENSPSERLLWVKDENEPQNNNSSVFFRRRKRMRARSSSPISSPLVSHSTPAVDTRKLAQNLRTPQADPALDLWAAVRGGASASGLTNPIFSKMDLFSPSQRPPRDVTASGKERGLKKSASYGSNWPKRRRLDRLDERDDGAEQNPLFDSKSAMVSALLETVDGELKRSESKKATVHHRMGPPQSSPQQPEVTPKGPPSSTSSNTIEEVSPMRSESSPLAQRFSRAEVDVPAAAISNAKAESDYGGDDLDDDTFMELEVSVLPAQEDDLTLVGSFEDGTRTKPTPKTDDDEFDLDDDVFDSAEDLVAQIEAEHISSSQFQGQKLQQSQPQPHFYQQQQQQQQQPPQQVSKLAGTYDGGAEDDYGDDDFGDDIDFDAVEFAATQAAASSHSLPTHPSQKPKAIQRYLVTNVLESVYEDDRGREHPEKIVIVQAERTKTIKTVHLRGDWQDTQVSPKAFVHIIGEFEPSGRCVIDNNHNLIILHPDQLISSTVVADSFTCMRRAVLQDRVKATSEATPALVYGTILHEVFQAALMVNNWELAYLASIIDKTLAKHIEDINVIKVSPDDARTHLLSKMPELRSWAQAFVSPVPRPNANVQGRNGEKVSMCVSKLLDVEEHVWSPMYGLKGNIDATVQVTMREGNEEKTLTVPFEVKTGKNATANHQAQTVLYNLLLSDRYDIDIVYGVLYYMETSQTLRIPAIRHELRHMIMQRNQLACYIRERSVQLPPMKRSQNACGRCYAQASCFIYHKLADNGDGESSGLNEKFDEVVQHLEPVHREFFLKWEDLLTKEEKESQKMRRELWTMVSTEREKVGRCFANVIIEEGSAFEDVNTAKINRFSYTFIKETPPPGFSFMDSQIVVGEPIVISDEQGHFALALGYVTAVRKQRISVAVDRRLHNARIRQPGFNEVDNQVFASIMEVAPEGAVPAQSQGLIKEAPIRFRLDKDEFSNGMATVRNNLVQIMTAGAKGFSRIRRLVVDMAPPSFKKTATQYTIAGKDSLNVDQKAAVEKVMSANDYALVLGMPGTGKTTTIAHIIRALVGQGKTLLLTSYTHTAVDNILLKLRNDNIPILRLGAPAKVHPEVRDFVTLASQQFKSLSEIQKAWHDTPVVATTCLGINHPVFNERKFDYCIVDEASQITLPICLGPIRMARTFVLVGDHNQLPPLVQNNEARLGGLDVSLFKLLSDTHPSSVVNLEHQYRMSEDIMILSNTLIYKGRLKCGTEALKTAELHIPNMDALKQRHYDAYSLSQLSSPTAKTVCPGTVSGAKKAKRSPCWLRDLLDPSTRVAFVNTDSLPSSEEQAKGNRIVNPCEVKVVTQLVDALLTVGVPAEEIGVMTHYRSQLALLKHSLRGSQVEMHTADRFQGRDKSVILLSLVRSNDTCSIGELLKDWRRINVAFTRAKTKLLVVGSKNTLGGCGEHEMVRRFVELMVERKWVYDLEEKALEGHMFEVGALGSGMSPMKGSGYGSPIRGREPIQSLEEMFKGMGSPSKRPGLQQVRENGKVKGKENVKVPKKIGGGRMRERLVQSKLKTTPVLRDILNDLGGGGY